MTMRTNNAKWIESQGRWQINVQKDGVRKTFVSSTPGRKGRLTAEQKADKWLATGLEGDVRFQILWDAALEEVKAMTGTENYVLHEKMGRLYILPRLGHKKLSSLTQNNYQQCINDAYEKGLSKKTCMHIRASIVMVYKFGRRSKKQIEPPDDLRIPKNAPVGQRTILQPEALRTLFENDTVVVRGKEVSAFFIHAWRLITLTGLRPGEVCGLKKEDVTSTHIRVRRSINRLNEQTRGKTFNAVRNAALSSFALKTINDQNKMLKENGIVSPWLFPQRTGENATPYVLYKRWETYRKQHGIETTPYELRHTMISIVKSSNIPEPLLKASVGHGKSMDTYGVYGHELDGDIELTQGFYDAAFKRFLE